MLQKLTSLLPARAISFAGRLQFRFPVLKTLVNRLGQIATGEGVIQRGVGKGLRFDATNCNPGYLTGTSAPEEQKLLAASLKEGDVFYDVGANAGFYAVIGARCVGAEGRVYAFEPTPELARRTRYNAAINEFGNVKVVEAAVCDRDGCISFGTEGFDVTNSIRKATEAPAIEVEAVRLDTWAAEKPPPDVIMMDIEGAEIDALHGAMSLIEKHRPLLMVEVHWLGERFVRFVKEHLEPLGYEAATYAGDSLPRKNRYRYHALLRPRHSEEKPRAQAAP